VQCAKLPSTNGERGTLRGPRFRVGLRSVMHERKLASTNGVKDILRGPRYAIKRDRTSDPGSQLYNNFDIKSRRNNCRIEVQNGPLRYHASVEIYRASKRANGESR
jgi:hypothetical protein